MANRLEDHSDEAKDRLNKSIYLALDQVGAFIMGEAQDELENDPRRVDTGWLKNHINYKVSQQDKQAMVGTNVEYAVYVHEGTGKYHPQGRPTPWRYKDDKGKWHTTSGMKPNRFLKNAVENNKDQIHGYLKDKIKP